MPALVDVGGGWDNLMESEVASVVVKQVFHWQYLLVVLFCFVVVVVARFYFRYYIDLIDARQFYIDVQNFLLIFPD